MLFVLALAAAASLAAASPADVDARTARMAALYDRVCLKAFPDDKAVEALMTAQGARALSAEEVKITMRDDPARGWELPEERATVWIEFPPFHACSVRWNMSRIGDLASYRAIADAYVKALGGFSPMGPYDADQGDLHIHAVGEARALADNGSESLFVFDQHVTDPKRRAAGEAGVSVRFVHQFAPPPPDSR